jgi:hypothetical protein
LSCSFYLYRFRKYLSYGFPIINFCNPGVHYETPCIIFKSFVADYPDYAAGNYEEGNYEDAAVKYEQDEDRYRDGEEENETNARNYNNEYEAEDY